MFEIIKELNRLNIGEKKLTIGDKYIWRPISHVILAPMISLGLRNPNHVTLLSIASLAIGVLADEYWVLYFVIWAILDCADGSLARYNKQRKIAYGNGELMDAIGGYLFIVAFWFKTFLVYNSDMALVALIMNLLARVIFLKYTLTSNPGVAKHMTRKSIFYQVYENIEFGSLMLIIFGIAQFTEFTKAFLASYTLLSILLFAYAILQSFRDMNKKYEL
jgi:phosphatidylglycerophosphate synthase